MKPMDFIEGYTLLILEIAAIQAVIVFAPANALLCILVSIPSALLFLGFGLLFGIILGEKAAPGICSIVITVSSMLGGIWMDVDAIGGAFGKACYEQSL